MCNVEECTPIKNARTKNKRLFLQLGATGFYLCAVGACPAAGTLALIELVAAEFVHVEALAAVLARLDAVAKVDFARAALAFEAWGAHALEAQLLGLVDQRHVDAGGSIVARTAEACFGQLEKRREFRLDGVRSLDSIQT